jgi:hypothetical protein
MEQPQAVVVGAGPAGLAAAERLAEAGVRVRIYERMPSPGRKLLIAGRGGLNLTHSEPLGAFVSRYAEAAERLTPAVTAFSPDALRAWSAGLGIETFVGSSGRVFPRAMKASPLLRAWLGRLQTLSVELRLRCRFRGWSPDGALSIQTPDGLIEDRADVVILALGGASWPRLGSDGGWTDALASRGVDIRPFEPSNCGFHCRWSDAFRSRHAGAWLKSARFSAGGQSVRGEAIISESGIEGGAVYALSSRLRSEIADGGEARLVIDLSPDNDIRRLCDRLSAGRASLSTANRLRRLGLSPAATALMREDWRGPHLPREALGLAGRIKGVELRLSSAGGLDRAISSAGGVRFSSIEPDYSVRGQPDLFVCGEMMDWEAPTGGYLLQACLATGRAAAEGALARISAASISN